MGQSTLLDKIMQADNLPSLPAVALQVLQMSDQEDISVNAIARVIERDPALTARILKVVNSPLFGLSKKIASLPQAMVVMGLRSVKVMALSFSLLNQMEKSSGCDFDYERFWKRSLTTSVSSRLLAEAYCPMLRDEAFVAGLLCDLGIIAALKCATREYVPITAEYKRHQMPLQKIEASYLGVTHAEISTKLLEKWGLPELVLDAVRHHHDASAPPIEHSGSILSRLVWAAALISDLFCADIPLNELYDITERIFQELDDAVTDQDVDEHDVERILEQIDAHVREIALEISVDIGETMTYEEMRLTAMRQIADLSMTAELDRAAAQKEVETLHTQTQRLAQEAKTDGLTKLANRQAFDDALSAAYAQSRQSGDSLGVIMLDLDRFKYVNDTYGHLFGDEVLKMVGQSLHRVANETHTVARFGGEEFAIICLKSTQAELQALAEEVRQHIQHIRMQYGTQQVQITASLGCAIAAPSRDAITLEQLVEQADKCLYHSKKSGRNRTTCAHSSTT